jgi:hypothetical protein
MTSAPSAARPGATADNSIAHKHVCPGKCTERGIDRNDRSALDQIVAARNFALLSSQ